MSLADRLRLDSSSAPSGPTDHNHRQLTVRGKRNKTRVVDLDFGGAYDIIRKLPVRLGCKWLFWHGDGEPYRNLSSRFAALVRGEHARAIEHARKSGLEEAFRRSASRHAPSARRRLAQGRPVDLRLAATTRAFIDQDDRDLSRLLTPEETRGDVRVKRSP